MLLLTIIMFQSMFCYTCCC